MNNIIFRIPPKQRVSTYKKVRAQLNGYDEIIFASMRQVGRQIEVDFQPPGSANEYGDKHREIEKYLGSAVLGGVNVAMLLMEEIFQQIQARGGLPRIHDDDLLDNMAFSDEDTNVSIRLTQDLRWAVVWKIRVPDSEELTLIVLDAYSRLWGEIVPPYIIEYINTAINAFKARNNLAATALASIVMEATLRDVLIANGVVYDPFASRGDVYAYVTAEVTEQAGFYKLAFVTPMPKAPSDFASSADATGKITIRARRTGKLNKKRIDLQIKAPPSLLDFWSSNHIVQRAGDRVGGLGEALDIARARGFLSRAILPEDFDDVIKTVRNHLVHLSGRALEDPLPQLRNRGVNRLGDFVNDNAKVFDLLRSIIESANELYNGLRQAGHTVP